jgi:glutamate:GABA antiporter
MAAQDTAGIAEGTLAIQEKAKLRKVLRRFDLVLFTACAIVSLDSVAAAAEAGAQAITWLAISLVVFLWAGFELSNGASEEMRNPKRDVPRMIVGSGIIAAVLYGVVILGIILVIPRTGLSSVAGFADAYNAVASVFKSHALNVVFAVLVIVTLIGSGSVWLEGADRTQAIAALDGAAPAWMGRFTSFGTPIAVNLSSGVVSSVMCVVIFVITKGSLASFFSVMLALTISTTTASYIFIFPALTILRRKYPDAERPYRVPGGGVGAWAAVIITEAFVVITVITLVWPGAINAWFGQTYSIESSWGVSRVFFESVTLGSFAVMVALGLVFWAIGERNRRRGIAGIAVPPELLGDVGLPSAPPRP